MDQMEKQKATLGAKLDQPDMGEAFVRKFALRVFNLADDEDRAGKANKGTALNFYSASQFFDVITQFGELDADLTEKQKYAKFKAADINSCLKKGIKPKPGPPGSEEEDEKLLEANGFGDSNSNSNPPNPQIDIPNFPDPPQNSNSSHIPQFPTNQTNSYPDIPSFPDPPTHKQGSNIPNPQFTNYNESHTTKTNSFDIPDPNFSQSSPTSSNQRPAQSHFQQPPPQQFQHQAAQQPQPRPAQNQPQQQYQPPPLNSNFQPTENDLTLANKYSKFVVSSLQFDDVPSAIKNCRLVLKHLTGQDH